MRRAIRTAAVAGLAALSGCTSTEIRTVTDLGAAVGTATGAITPEEAASIQRSGQAIARTFEDFTPQQEYYIGRSVGATILESYRIDEDPAATRYLNLLGQSLAEAGPRPETFAGYRFRILKSDEINAFAAPGGFIFISRGMLDLCRSEDEAAAVLAHEIAHVAGRHGLAAIKKGRVTAAFAILAAEGMRTFGNEELAELTDAFEGSVSDVVSTLTNAGYARDQEREADAEAVRILARAGYDPAALVRVLEAMQGRLRPDGRDFARTHPPPAARIRDLAGLIDAPVVPGGTQRAERFREALGRP